ncbi:MAG: Na(+)/H(+) antiporter subunit D [Candidatus Latescibacterota bacterium]|nr:Na(+)/H(+) antiporter subunit D [Candidatus Latescibacterota bacterium]
MIESSLHPALILIVGSLILPLVRGHLRSALLVLIPLVGFVNILGLEAGDNVSLMVSGIDIHVLHVDKLSLLFGYLFHVAALMGAIFALHVKDSTQLMTAMMYAGSAVGAVFAGDLITLFIFWELLAVTSVFQIWANKTERAISAGIRYLLIHVSSGLLLITGAAIRYHEMGQAGLTFEHMQLEGLGSWCLLLAIGIKCAFPFLHTWLVDAYPEATPTGTVFLSSFTTKTAVYCLARGFAGTEELIWVGGAMAMFPIFFAVIENDLRRVLGYSMINQIGFMVCGIGLGEGMGVNGAVAHAFNDVFFKGVLFMSLGAVLFRTGRINGSDLGGLYRSMPWTAGFCITGACSISAFPLFSGFVSKSMVMAEAANQNYVAIWLMLLFASAGVFHHAGIKIPFFAFFSHDSGIRCKEAPRNMLIAMGLGSAICLFNGMYPWVLYSLLPYPVNYEPYTATHVVLQLQLLFFSALAFASLKLTGLYPPELRSLNIDADIAIRKWLPGFGRAFSAVGGPFRDATIGVGKQFVSNLIASLKVYHGPGGLFSRPWLTSSSILVVLAFLTLFLISNYRAH